MVVFLVVVLALTLFVTFARRPVQPGDRLPIARPLSLDLSDLETATGASGSRTTVTAPPPDRSRQP
ncbi:MAG: hypothetical protein AB7P03_12575 [Kofleriaceae bacterium]